MSREVCKDLRGQLFAMKANIKNQVEFCIMRCEWVHFRDKCLTECGILQESIQDADKEKYRVLKKTYQLQDCHQFFRFPRYNCF